MRASRPGAGHLLPPRSVAVSLFTLATVVLLPAMAAADASTVEATTRPAVEVAPAPNETPAPAPSSEEPTEAPPPDPAHAIGVDFSADFVGAQLYRLPSGTGADSSSEWVPVCTAPCKTLVDRRFRYAVWGGNVSPSHSFSLATSSSVQADIARRSTRIVGWIMLGVGSGIAMTGGLWLGIASQMDKDRYYLEETDDSSHGSSHQVDASEFFRIGGIVLVVAGAAVAVTGLVLGLRNTTVDINPSSSTNNAMFRFGPRGLEF